MEAINTITSLSGDEQRHSSLASQEDQAHKWTPHLHQPNPTCTAELYQGYFRPRYQLSRFFFRQRFSALQNSEVFFSRKSLRQLWNGTSSCNIIRPRDIDAISTASILKLMPHSLSLLFLQITFQRHSPVTEGCEVLVRAMQKFNRGGSRLDFCSTLCDRDTEMASIRWQLPPAFCGISFAAQCSQVGEHSQSLEVRKGNSGLKDNPQTNTHVHHSTSCGGVLKFKKQN